MKSAQTCSLLLQRNPDHNRAVPCSARNLPLFETQDYARRQVYAHHIPWRLMQPDTLACWHEELARYATVYCSNYDLLAPWAVMQAPNDGQRRFINSTEH